MFYQHQTVLPRFISDSTMMFTTTRLPPDDKPMVLTRSLHTVSLLNGQQNLGVLWNQAKIALERKGLSFLQEAWFVANQIRLLTLAVGR